MADVFISYSRTDEEIAGKFASALKASGLDVWWDQQLRSGETYDETTERALTTAGAVIVLWSPRSVKSRWVRSEAAVADRSGSLMPAMIEPCDRPVMFELTQAADLCTWNGELDHHCWQSFLKDIRERLSARGGAAPSSAPEETAASPVASLPAKRLSTILHCAIEVSDAAALDMDPEDWQDLMVSFQDQCAQVLGKYDVALTSQPNGTFFAIFGEDRSREDDAESAVTAALELFEMKKAHAQQADFHLRAGLETGTVVVSGSGAQASAFGPVIGRAERLRLRADPDAILLGSASETIIGPYFELEAATDGGFRVLGRNKSETRFDVSRARGLSGFVGRDNELAILEDALESARQGQSPVIGICAEAGTGKSRLCFEFVERCRREGVPVYEGGAVAHGRNIPLLPVLNVFRSFFGIAADDPDEAAQRKVEDRLAALDPRLVEALPLILDFLNIPDPERPAPRLDPNIRQRQVIGAMRHAFNCASKEQVTVTLIEDLHWMDAASVQFLDQMVEPGSGSRNLLSLNYRPEFHAEWMNKPWFKTLALTPLNDSAIGELLSDILGTDNSVAALTGPLLERTGGNPFFTEELVRNLAETDVLEGERGRYRLVSEITNITVPNTVKTVIAARVDRLGEHERDVLQLAAVIGKDFDQSLLMSACDLSSVEVDEALDSLRRAEFVLEKSFFPDLEFSFRHPLTQEVALESLVRDRRRQLHRAVARAIEAREAGQEEERAALLAHHWEAAADNLAAARYHRVAAEWMGLTDLTTAEWHWSRVRTLLKTVPSGDETAALGGAACRHLLNLGWRFGIDAAEVAALEQEGRGFAQSVGDWQAELYVSMVCSRALASVGDVAGFVELARENYIAAKTTDDTALRVNASLYLVDALVWTGQLPEALDIAEAALEKVSKDVPPSEWIMGFNPHTVLKFWRATCLVMMGRLDEGLEEYRQCRPLLEADGTPEGVAYLLSWSALAYLSAGDIEQVELCGKIVDEVCTDIGDPATVVAHRHLCETYLHLGCGDADGAVTSSMAALEIHKVSEQQHAGMTATFVAEALLRSGRAGEAVAMADEAIVICQGSRRANLEAQAHGVRAAALLARDGGGGVEEAREAIARASELVETTGARTLAPGLLEIKALLAEAEGDASARTAFLEQAATTYEDIGAAPHAARVRAGV